MGCNRPCEGCALSPGAVANLEPDNHLMALICVLGPIPFLCHEGQNWEDSEEHKLGARKLFLRGFKICRGWQREVRRLAATGYYQEHPGPTKSFAQIAAGELQLIIDGKVEGKRKDEAWELLQAMVVELTDKRAKFVKRQGQ